MMGAVAMRRFLMEGDMETSKRGKSPKTSKIQLTDKNNKADAELKEGELEAVTGGITVTLTDVRITSYPTGGHG
jgi:hypothetical protein